MAGRLARPFALVLGRYGARRAVGLASWHYEAAITAGYLAALTVAGLAGWAVLAVVAGALLHAVGGLEATPLVAGVGIAGLLLAVASVGRR